jgi:hypothetical protein
VVPSPEARPQEQEEKEHSQRIASLFVTLTHSQYGESCRALTTTDEQVGKLPTRLSLTSHSNFHPKHKAGELRARVRASFLVLAPSSWPTNTDNQIVILKLLIDNWMRH